MDPVENVMKKCTLCVDRIYNDNLPEIDRTPACVRTCPANARHFGDFADPNSNVSKMTRERGGFDLMPEMGTKPVNQYLPPRPKSRPEETTEIAPAFVPKADEGLLGWLDRALEKLG
jgi:Fe-S-cluster-containing dehydrogenase component